MKLTIKQLSLDYEMTEGNIISIGRKGYDADIQIDNPNISRQHAKVKLDGKLVKILDENSTNGVLLNGERIKPGEWHTLLQGNKIAISDYTLDFLIPETSLKSVTDLVQLKPAEIVDKPNAIVSKADEVNTGTDLNTKFKELINRQLPIKIGRSNTNDIVLPDKVENDRIVSRSHAELTFRDGKYWIEDLGSTNGTYLNDEKLTPKQPRPIEKGDMVLIHLHHFSLAEGYRDLRQEVAIRADGIGKTYSNGFVGLKPMTVEIPYKQIVALMGPSGCGKSTLLKTLNGDNPATSGNVFIHGLSLRENYKLLKRKIGYVPQDDTIHKELTVEKTLYLAAKLRLPDDTKNDEIYSRIAEVLVSLNFNDDVRNKKVGGLSGGQRKRVCIAVELLSRPTILFLDEPTSPLDPETIEEFLKSLQKLAQKGTTIVMVTHKPEDLNYADKVIFMAAAGYFVYYGNKEGLIKKFDVDHIIKVYTVCGSQDENKKFDIDKFYIKPTSKIIPREPIKDLSIDKQNSLLLQFYWLSIRYLNIKLNDRDNLYLLMAQPVIIAGLVAFIFHEVNVAVMLLIAVSAIWFGVSNSSKEIVGEYPVYKRERMFNLNIHTYILSKWAILSLIALVQVIIFIGIIHLRFSGAGNATLGNYGQNVACMFCVASSATLIGLFLSSYFDTTEKVLTVVPIALMPQIMLAGVVEPITSLKVDILSYLTLGRWGTEGFMRLQIGPFGSPPPPHSRTLDDVYYSQLLKHNTGESQIIYLCNSLAANIGAIVVVGVIMYVLTYLSLKKKDTI